MTAQAITGVEREPFPVEPIDPAPDPAETTDGSTGSLPSDLGSTGDYGGYDDYDSYNGYDSYGGGSGFGGGTGSGGGSGIGGGGGSETTKDAPKDPGPDLGVPGDGATAETEEAPDAILLAAERDGSPLPDTWVMLAGLAALAVILAAGFVVYRRRLP